MNDQRFFDLAMKVIGGQATDADRANLDALLTQEPDLRTELMRLGTDAAVAKEALPLITACTALTGDFPAYARERLQTAVRQTLGRPKLATRELPRGWRWVLSLAIATAVVLLLALPLLRAPNTPVIELAILDVAGGTRSLVSLETNEAETLQETWKGTPVQRFSSISDLQTWEKNWPTDGGRPAARIIYDRAAGEVRVSGRSKGRFFQKTFPVERDLATTLQQVRLFIQEQMKR